jgi:predicted Zn-dependent protease
LSLLTPWTLAAEGVASGALVAEAQGNLDRAATLHALAARMVPHECQHALNAAAAAERADAVRSAPTRVESLERCARLEPHNAFVLHHLGRARAAAGRPDAVEALRRAVEASPQDALFRVGLARALLREGNAQEALVHARQAVALEPDTAACQRALADVHLTLGHTRQANEARGRADALGRHGP